MCSELGFSYLHARKSKEAIAQFLNCMAITQNANLLRKSEMAFNLAQAYAPQSATGSSASNGEQRPRSGRPRAHPSLAISPQHPDSVQPCTLLDHARPGIQSISPSEDGLGARHPGQSVSRSV